MPTIYGLPDLPSGVLLNGTEEVAVDVETSPGVFETFKTTTGAIADLSGGSSGGGGGGGITDLTGDVTASGTGSVPATIPNNTVTYAKMQDVSAASRLLGRGSAGGAGDSQEITLGTGLALTGTTLDATGGLAAIGANELLANLTGSPALPIGVTYLQFFSDFPYQSGGVSNALVPVITGGGVVLVDASNLPGGGGLPSIGANSLLVNTTGASAVPTGTTYYDFLNDFPYQSGAVPSGALIPMVIGLDVVLMPAGNLPGGGGLPPGGAAGEVLYKLTGADGDAAWENILPFFVSKQSFVEQQMLAALVVVDVTEAETYTFVAAASQSVNTRPGRIAIQSINAVGAPDLTWLDFTTPSTVTVLGEVSGISANDQKITGTQRGDVLLRSEADKVLLGTGTTLCVEADGTALRALVGDVAVAEAGRNLKIEGAGGTLMLKGGTSTPASDMCDYAQLTGGTVTVTCDGYFASTGDPVILVKHASATTAANNGVLYLDNQVDGQFDIKSTNSLDDGLVFWAVLKVNTA